VQDEVPKNVDDVDDADDNNDVITDVMRHGSDNAATTQV